MSAPEPSAALRAGRRGLASVTGLRLIEDFVWFAPRGRYLLRCTLCLEQVPEGGAVPRETSWVIEVEPSYPFGEITFWPAIEGGLEGTFPHQAMNEIVDELPFRSGQVCLTQNYTASRGRPDETEPYDADGRLRWHAEQALGWLRAAARGELTEAGAHFLLPSRMEYDAPAVIYAAGEDELVTWLAQQDRVGLVSLRSPLLCPGCYLVACWSSLGGEREVQATRWGATLHLSFGSAMGLWLRLDRVPHVRPWRMPLRWGELVRACQEQGVDLPQLLRLGLGRYREGVHVPLLLGYPIPERFGGAPVSMHWDALWLQVCPEIPGEQAPIPWAFTSNWHPAWIGARGRLPAGASEKTILLIGAGALGSAVAEMLVRGGVGQMIVQDPDLIHAGNLARHTGLLVDLEKPKAEALAARLALATPHVWMKFLPGSFPPEEEAYCRVLDEAQVVLDTTGDDGVIHALGEYPWGKERIFLSLSLGRGARRLFCFCSRGRSFPRDRFHEALGPYLLRERGEGGGPQLAAGCRDPFFPARIDDVWLLAAVAIKQIAAWLEDPPPPDVPLLAVFAQDGRGAVSRVDAPR